jgi:hypothetical protein
MCSSHRFVVDRFLPKVLLIDPYQPRSPLQRWRPSCRPWIASNLRDSLGATRLQEVLADRASARLYGARPFEEGLRHVLRREIEFNYFAGKEIKEALTSGRALQNVYELEMQPEKTLEEAIDHAINRQTSEDDTHPSPADRFRLASRVMCQNQPAPPGPKWNLFADREAISNEMSVRIEKMVKAPVA